jgi:hypothetical protein
MRLTVTVGAPELLRRWSAAFIFSVALPVTVTFISEMLEHEVLTVKLADESVSLAVMQGSVVSGVAAWIDTMADISVRTTRNAGVGIDYYWHPSTKGVVLVENCLC